MQAIMLCSHLFLFPKRSQRRSAPLSLPSHHRTCTDAILHARITQSLWDYQPETYHKDPIKSMQNPNPEINWGLGSNPLSHPGCQTQNKANFSGVVGAPEPPQPRHSETL